MIVMAVERFADVRDEIMPLWRDHYREAATDQDAVPFDMNVDAYAGLDEEGSLILVTARSGLALVGYVTAFVGTHLHCQGLKQAVGDLHYVAPRYRGGRTAMRLFEALEAEAKRLGIRRIMIGTPAAKPQGRLLTFLGFRPIEAIYAKVI